MKKRLRDFLQNLLKGSSSPQKLKLTYAVLQYIKEHSSDLGIRYKIHLELDESIVIYSNEVTIPKFRINGFDDYSGKYRIVDDQCRGCNILPIAKAKGVVKETIKPWNTPSAKVATIVLTTVVDGGTGYVIGDNFDEANLTIGGGTGTEPTAWNFTVTALKQC